MQKLTSAQPPASSSAMATQPNTESRNDVLVAKVPQGFETNINVRIVPGRDIAFPPEAFGCQPRGNRPARPTVAVKIPDALVAKLKGSNKAMVKWLAKDEANANLFLARPVDAMVEAGIDLTRAEQKLLARTHRTVRETAVLPPGAVVTELATSVHPRGRIGKIRPKPSKKRPTEAECGPTEKRKE